MKISFHEIAKIVNRITGVSVPIFGISWNPPPSEVVIAEKLLTFLSDRRVLHAFFADEVTSYCTQSILKIRDRLTADLEQLNRASKLAQSLAEMRTSCRDYLDAEQSMDKSPASYHKVFMALSRLRGVFAVEIGKLSAQHGIDLDEDLARLVTRFDAES
jgi:hypothetical protein